MFPGSNLILTTRPWWEKWIPQTVILMNLLVRFRRRDSQTQAFDFSGFFLISGFFTNFLCLKWSWKKRSSHQGEKEVACIVSKPLISCLWACGESVNSPKWNIQEVQGALSSRPKEDPGLLPIFQDVLLLSNNTPDLFGQTISFWSLWVSLQEPNVFGGGCKIAQVCFEYIQLILGFIDILIPSSLTPQTHPTPIPHSPTHSSWECMSLNWLPFKTYQRQWMGKWGGRFLFQCGCKIAQVLNIPSYVIQSSASLFFILDCKITCTVLIKDFFLSFFFQLFLGKFRLKNCIGRQEYSCT